MGKEDWMEEERTASEVKGRFESNGQPFSIWNKKEGIFWRNFGKSMPVDSWIYKDYTYKNDMYLHIYQDFTTALYGEFHEGFMTWSVEVKVIGFR